MKKHLISLIALLAMLPAIALAGGTVTFKLTGLEQGDTATVSISSSEYLATMSLGADGEYSFSDVPAGTHAVKVEPEDKARYPCK